MKKVVTAIVLISMLLSCLTVFTGAYRAGDFNGDGKINAVDSSIMTGIVLGRNMVRTQSRADFNGDNKVNSADTLLMSMYFVGKYEIGGEVEGDFYSATETADKYKDYLSERLGSTKDDVVLGIGDSDRYGIDMSDYENDGYLIRNSGTEVLLFAKSEAGLDKAARAYAKAEEAGEKAEETEYHKGFRIKEMKIFDTDLSEYSILVTNESNGNMVFAAGELSRLLERATGIKVPVITGTTELSHVIEFRNSDDSALENDGYSYFCDNGRLVIEGAYQRGCMYGVWRFLENECGWVELTFGDSDLTPAELVSITEDVYNREVPGTKSFTMYEEAPPASLVFVNEKGTPKSGQNGAEVLQNCCHGMQSNKWAGIDVMYKQMCYTNKDNLANTIASVEAYLNARKAKIGKSILAVDLAQGDNNDYCICRTCRKVFEEEGNTNAGAVLRFANSVCEYFEDDYPDLKFQIFAYSGSNIPPAKTRAHRNVSVTFCYDFSCSNHPLDGSECVEGFTTGIPGSYVGRSNKEMNEWLTGWCDISENVCVWYYALDCGLMGYPVLDTILPDFKYFYNLGIVRIFWQIQNFGFGPTRIEYMLAQEVLWNPQMTEEEYWNYYETFMAEEYGEGWRYIDQYLKTWTEAHDRMGCWHCWGGLTQPWCIRLDAEYIGQHFDENLELFNKALALADSEKIETRIKLLSIQMYYQGIYGASINAIKDGTFNSQYDKYKVLYEHCVELETSMLYAADNIRTWDGARYSMNTTYDGALIAFIYNYYDPFYVDVQLDKNLNIIYNGKVIRKLVAES